jgi:hypothetical protein
VFICCNLFVLTLLLRFFASASPKRSKGIGSAKAEAKEAEQRRKEVAVKNKKSTKI